MVGKSIVTGILQAIWEYTQSDAILITWQEHTEK
jgi:hypothetical protein